MSIRNILKGWFGESMGAAAQWLLLDEHTYRSINNVTLNARGGTTQIDHVIVSRFGIFVVETKNIDGWIFGDERSAQWTVVRFGRKYRIQNPRRQNYRHTRAIGEFPAYFAATALVPLVSSTASACEIQLVHH
jgi:hypothetical protein